MAATDYLTMKRVRALDYTIPPVCDADAADLIKRLLVRYPMRLYTGRGLTFSQVLDPVERLGVPPKSSPEDIRQHSFFVGGKLYTPSKNSPRKVWSTINWTVLWTDPAPEIEVGPYYSRPQENFADDLWEGFDGLQVGSDE